jgi:hypothetical protein
MKSKKNTECAICEYEGCKEKATGYYYGKKYCSLHYNIVGKHKNYNPRARHSIYFKIKD